MAPVLMALRKLKFYLPHGADIDELPNSASLAYNTASLLKKFIFIEIYSHMRKPVDP